MWISCSCVYDAINHLWNADLKPTRMNVGWAIHQPDLKQTKPGESNTSHHMDRLIRTIQCMRAPGLSPPSVPDSGRSSKCRSVGPGHNGIFPVQSLLMTAKKQMDFVFRYCPNCVSSQYSRHSFCFRLFRCPTGKPIHSGGMSRTFANSTTLPKHTGMYSCHLCKRRA